MDHSSHLVGISHQSAPPERPPTLPGYDVGELIGAGASGTVWSALRQDDARAFAVKVLRPGAGTGDADAVAREVAVLRRLPGEHLVRIHDVVVQDDGEVALVLDLMTGGTLGQVLRARGRLSAGETVTVLSPLASALGELHAAGVLHADLAPGNVLFDRAGRPRLADLGTARIRGDLSTVAHGTSGFVAPEVLLGEEPSAASDVYAVGALGWFCLTGAAPGPAQLRGRLAHALGDGDGAERDAVVRVLDKALRGGADERPDAVELAVELYDAATPQPLRLVTADDDVSALTHRIREAARASPDPTPRSHRRARRGGGRSSRGRASVRERPLRPARPGRPRLLAAAATAAALGSLVALGGLVLKGDQQNGAGVGPEVTAPAPAAAPGSSATPAAATDTNRDTDPMGDKGTDPKGGKGTDVLQERSAPSSDPVALVQALADARAGAWAAGVAVRLRDVDAPGSPALTRDTEALGEVQQAGARYTGLTFTVRSAEPVRAESGRAEEARASVRTVVDTSAYRVTTPGGDTPGPARRAEEVQLDLVWTGLGWRVHDVSPPP